MSELTIQPELVHPMVKFQHQVAALVKRSKMIKTEDPLWKIAFLFEDQWSYWRSELDAFGFSMQDPIAELLAVDSWEED